MNPRIYESRAAKQAEYREAKKLGMTCAEYRAHIAAGGKPAPSCEGNRGWYGSGAHAGSRYNEKPTVTPPDTSVPVATITPVPRRKTHIASPKPDNAKYITACGKFLEDVQVFTDINLVTCGKCRTNFPLAKSNERRKQVIAAQKADRAKCPTVTPPEPIDEVTKRWHAGMKAAITRRANKQHDEILIFSDYHDRATCKRCIATEKVMQQIEQEASVTQPEESLSGNLQQ